MAVITISRQFGAGGKTLGEMIAKKLGYTFVDHLLIQMVAEKTKVSTQWVKSMEKEAGNKFLKFISGLVSTDYMTRILESEHGYLNEKIYVDALHEVIQQIADEGSAVILGRGGQYILKDRQDAYHILLIAEKEDRIKFMEKHYRLSPDKATQTVNEEDKRRINLYRSFGKEDYDNPKLYHLVLNMSRLSMDKACDLICALPV